MSRLPTKGWSGLALGLGLLALVIVLLWLGTVWGGHDTIQPYHGPTPTGKK